MYPLGTVKPVKEHSLVDTSETIDIQYMIVLAFRFQEIDFCASYCSKPPPAQVSLECEGPQVCLSFQFGGILALFCFSDQIQILQFDFRKE